MTRAEEYSIKYADEQLAIIDKELFETNYSRHTKMGVHIFNGSDIEQAAMSGYEQAEKDIITLIESRLSELLGDAQPTPILRYELQDLIKKIKEEE